MCGIAAIVSESSNVDPIALSRLTESLKHRGPDARSTWQSGRVGLGHARLSVIDLDGGGQPMVDEASGAVLVFNGELYNYVDLRAELASLGHTFRTKSDTEVLLRAYLQWGEGCLNRLDGMFACALWDERRRGLFIARDPIGIKPLYYARDGERFIVASELRSLLGARLQAPRFSSVGLAHYLVQGYALAPDTVIEDVWQLQHGHSGFLHEGQLTLKRYVDLADAVNGRAGQRLSDSDALSVLETQLTDAVRAQLCADVPIGFFLSAGIDSTAICGVAAALPGVPRLAFTADFSGPGYGELDRARETARVLGFEHRRVLVDGRIGLHNWEVEAARTDAPIFDNSFVPTRALCEAARQEVTVVLSGDGGDELFLGYETYRADALAQRLRPIAPRLLSRLADRIPVGFGKVTTAFKVRAFARSMTRPTASAHCGWRELCGSRTLLQILPPKVAASVSENHPSSRYTEAFERVGEGDLLTRLSYVDLETWLPNDLLVQADRASMAHGLEVRVPLLDFKLAPFAMGLPDATKSSLRLPKKLLRQVAARRVPGYPMRGVKRGFNAPMSEWLAGPLTSALDRLVDGSGPLSELVLVDPLRRLIADHRERRDDHGLLLWSLLVLDAWGRSVGCVGGGTASSAQ